MKWNQLRGSLGGRLLALASVSILALGACSSGGASQAPASQAASAAPASQALTGRLKAVKDRGELRVAGPVYLPFVIQKPDGTYDGIDVTALKRVSDKLGVKLTMVPAGWDTVVAGLTTDKWDVVPSLCVTAERSKVIDYTNPYVDLKTTFYVKKDNPKNLQTLADLDRPDVIHVVATGSAGAETIHKRFPHATIKELPGISDPEMLQEILSGRADVGGTDWPVTYSVITAKAGDQLRFIPADPKDMFSSECPVAWGIPKGDTAFQSYLNGFLKDFIDSGEFKKLNDEWFSPDKIKTLFP